MANNPLFPGYIPQKEGDSTNPLFPGYSQGQRAYRPPPGVPLGKYEYNADYWLEQLDQMSFDAGNLPKWFLDRYVDDFKSNLKATYNPGDIPVEQMDDYDQDVMPGVSSISLTLDPAEWQDPGKVLEKTAKSWIKAGTGLRFQKKGWGLEAWPVDLTDYDTRVKSGMWRVAMGLQEDVSPLGREGGVSITSATKAMAGSPDSSGALFNFPEADYVDGVGKIYETMAKNVVDVQKVMQAGQKRDGKFDSFVSSLSKGIGAELNGKYNVPDLDEAGVQKVDSKGNPLTKSKSRVELFSQLYSDPKQAENFQNAVKILAEKNKLANDMDIVMDGAISGRFGLKSALKARISGSTDEEARWDSKESPTGTQTRFEAKMASLKTNISNRLAATGDDSIDQTIERVKKIDLASATALQKHTDMYKEYLRKVQDALNTYTGDDRQLYNKIANITVNGKELTGGGLFDTSIHRGLLRQMESDIILPGKLTSVDKRFQIGTYLSELEQLSKQPNLNGETLEQLFQKDGQVYKGFFANKARMVASRLEIDRGSYAIQEFYDAVTEGKFMERYVWNKLSKKLVGYTPGEIATQTLNKVGYFGLVIDDNYISDGLRNSKRFNDVFRHKFTVELDNKDGVFQGGNKIGATFLGDKKLAAVETLGNTLSNVSHLSDDDLLDLIRGKTADGTARKITDTVLDKNGKLVKIYGEKLPGFWSKDDHFLEIVQKQIDDFKEWLKTNGASVGISWDDFQAMDADTQKRVLALFNGLNKENQFYGSLKITKEFSGAIQRLGVGLNKLQNKIFGFALFQKAIRPVLQIKTIVAEKISEVVATIITELATKFLHAATGGATVVLDYLIEKVLKPLVRFITRKVVEFGQNFVGALAQGDINKAIAQIDKEIGQVVKFSMYVIGIPLILIYILVYGLFGTVLSSISPIDPTRDNSGYGGTGAGLPQGENALIKIEKDVEVSFASGTPNKLNPTESLDNGELVPGITATYTIRITPKVDIEGASVVFSDVVTQLTKNGETTVATLADNQNLGAFTAGETYTLTLNGVSLGTAFENSLLKNTLSVETPSFQGTAAETVTFARYLRIGTPPVPMDCFVFQGFPGGERANFEAALWNISGITGTFLGTLCSDDKKITLSRVSGGGGYCGFASGSGIITFNDTCTSYYTRLNATSYLLAHELGHIYNFWRLNTSTAVPGFPGGFDSVKGLEGGKTLPTYDGNCTTNNSTGEDFAETIGDMVAINTFGSCSATAKLTYPLGDYNAFWDKFPVHQRFAQEVLFVR
ncbi:hypothetical protein P147_WWE3C00001G0717 [candidate division WWE3 bacterium RAAC2_WWE3_1]|nr:hypothetical protein P147_WWE3C00001G0717 [candidate division WWE3 bacterium RAAC2_WWE3_1]KKS54721.1 MAG: hypothetical protein UV21_C0005G0085 [candidate division WWE3 bacterium GW2011_GWD2_42_34]KKT10431.1 MAG: hypothetical protein UV90_C0005G0078 [candidate division WWE3 bacterium GW2011_GWA2_43_24]